MNHWINDSTGSFKNSDSFMHSATEQTYRLWKPINMKLDMCDDFIVMFKSISFQISQHINIVSKS